MLLVKAAKKCVVFGLSLGVIVSSYAEIITGAGAPFPYPIYAK